MRKLTLSLSDKEYELLTRLAKDGDKGKTDVVRDALKLRDFFQNEVATGSKVLIERTDAEHLMELPIGKLL